MSGRAMRILVHCANPALNDALEAVLAGEHISLTFVDSEECLVRLGAYDVHDLMIVEPSSATDQAIRTLREDAFTYGRQRPAVLALYPSHEEKSLPPRLYDIVLTHPFVPTALLNAVCQTIDQAVFGEIGANETGSSFSSQRMSH